MRSMRRYQIILLIIFIALIIASVILSLIYQLNEISQILLVSNFVIAILIAVYGSLHIRQEEEERTT